MKKILITNFLIILIASGSLDAQVDRIVLLEEATNTSCPPCAENNPKLQAFFKSHFGGVISVRYHAWWPGGNDPMYLLNPLENVNRIRNYYSIWGVPHYIMDGINYGEPLDSLLMIDQMNYHLSITAPVKIKVSANIDADSVRATLKLTGISPVSQTQLKFRSAIIERMVQYSSPPGSNGETIFPDVFRKMLPDTNGFAIENINPGDEMIFYVSYPVNSQWNWQNLAIVAWLQSDENLQPPIWPLTYNHEIIQSAINIPTYIIKSDDPLGVFLLNNQSYSKKLKIINDNDVSLHLRLKVTDAQVPPGWSYELTYNDISIDSIDVTISQGDSTLFGLNIHTNSDSGIIRVAVFAQNLDDPYDYGYTANCLGIIKEENSNTLFVDDDGGNNSEIPYFKAFDSVGVCYMVIEKNLIPPLKAQIINEGFKAVFWIRSGNASQFSRLDIDFLEDYLDSGGNLFLSTSDGYMFDGTDSIGVKFCHNYLDAEFYNSLPSSNLLVGVNGTLGEGIITNLNSEYHVVMGSYSGSSDTIFQYGGTSQYGGLSYDAGAYKVVLQGAGLEQFTTASAGQELIQKVVNWFGVPVGISRKNSNIPICYHLEQNYPNPFNPNTRIKYSVPITSFVQIKVFDVLGNEIETLVNQEKQAGSYEVTFEAFGYASGIYFCQMKANTFIATKKMILLR